MNELTYKDLNQHKDMNYGANTNLNLAKHQISLSQTKSKKQVTLYQQLSLFNIL